MGRESLGHGAVRNSAGTDDGAVLQGRRCHQNYSTPAVLGPTQSAYIATALSLAGRSGFERRAGWGGTVNDACPYGATSASRHSSLRGHWLLFLPPLA